MPQSLARTEMIKRLYDAAVRDDRIVGLVDFGSGGQGRVDEWSDIDAAVILRGTDYSAFLQEWQTWARQFGKILLRLKGNNSSPWVIYAAEPIPLRIDFIFRSDVDLFYGQGFPVMLEDNRNLERMILYETDEKLVTEFIRPRIGKKESPPMEAEFEKHSATFWHNLQDLYGKFQRGEVWVAREVFTMGVLESLLRLLRLEARALDRWDSGHAGWNIEHSLSPERLEQLNSCIPPADKQGFMECLHRTAQLGYEVCTVLGNRAHVQWSKELAEKMIAITAEQ